MRLIDVDTLPKLLDAEYKQTMKLIREGEKHLDTLAEGFTEASHIAKYIAPTVDAVPVVYCKDCKYADTERKNATEKRYADSILFCRNSDLCNDEPLAMWPVDFCSYGVARKVVDDES